MKEGIATLVAVGLVSFLLVNYSMTVQDSLNMSGSQSFLIDDDEYEFMRFITEYGRTYQTRHEYNLRFLIFKENLREMERINSEQNDF